MVCSVDCYELSLDKLVCKMSEKWNKDFHFICIEKRFYTHTTYICIYTYIYAHIHTHAHGH